MTRNLVGPSNIGLAVALVTLARFIRLERPSLSPFLKIALDDAAKSGIAESDLGFMKTLIAAVEAKVEPKSEGAQPSHV